MMIHLKFQVCQEYGVSDLRHSSLPLGNVYAHIHMSGVGMVETQVVETLLCCKGLDPAVLTDRSCMADAFAV